MTVDGNGRTGYADVRPVRPKTFVAALVDSLMGQIQSPFSRRGGERHCPRALPVDLLLVNCWSFSLRRG